MFEPIERKSVVDMVSDRIFTVIGDGRLQPGNKLPSEKELVNALGVSRQSVRESLKRIEAIGLIQSK